MAKNTPAPPPPGSVVLTPAAIAFAFGMLAVGLVIGYLLGTSQAPRTVATAPPAVSAPASAPGKDKVVNNTDGKLRKLSEEEKAELLAKRQANSAREAASAEPDADSVYWTDAIQASFSDDIVKAEYQRAVGLMNKGNARGARPTLTKLGDDSTGKKWREPVLAMLAEARAATGEIKTARQDITTFRKEFGDKSPYAATVAVAEAKTYMQEGKRARQPNAAKTDISPEKREKYNKAIALFGDAIKKWPEHEAVADAYLNQSALHLELSQWDEAERAALGLAHNQPDHPHAPRALANVGGAAFDQGDYARAERTYQQLVDTFPQDRMAQSARSKLSSLQLLGKPAPEFDIEEWLGNDPGALATLKGKAVMLVFWATWCPHCRKEMPHIEEVHQKWKDKGLVVVGVTRNTRGQTTDKVREYIGSNGLTLPIAIDSGGTSRDYGVAGIPAAAIVGKDGTVVFRNHPAQITDELLQEILSGKS